jgi:hypothetical protein
MLTRVWRRDDEISRKQRSNPVGGVPAAGSNQSCVSELARRLLRKSIGSMRRQCVQCTSCRRTPLPGEFVHRLASERVVCSLCLANVPAAQRADAEPERVHAAERPLSVAPRAA